MRNQGAKALHEVSSDRFRPWLLTLTVLGAALRLALASVTTGVGFDIDSYRIVDAVLRRDPLHLYGIVNAFAVSGVTVFRWPYPPAYLPVVAAAGWISRHLGIAFATAIKLAPCAADCGLAWVVDWGLRRRRAAPTTRLLSATLLLFGPVLVAVSAYHGQLDSVAVLPAVSAVVLWERWPWTTAARRWHSPVCGALVGLAIALKIAPGVVGLGLLADARSRRERGMLLVSAAAAPVLLTLPFAIADPRGVLGVGRYTGVVGLGGIGMFTQPQLVGTWLRTGGLSGVGPAALELARHGSWVTAVALALAAAWLLARRVPPTAGAAAAVLVVVVAGAGFAFQYLVWVVPLLLLAGRVGWAAVVQALALVPMVLFYGRIGGPVADAVYIGLMTALWLALVAALVSLLGEVGEPAARPAAV